jgi:hypothetical protein
MKKNESVISERIASLAMTKKKPPKPRVNRVKPEEIDFFAD